jgi:ParB family transcriptional regulator, chromosome partitioning protein
VPKFKTVPRSALLEPPTPLRLAMDEGKLAELAQSIAEFGLMQPICVTPKGDKFEIIDGHRRYMATGQLGLQTVAVAIFDNVEEAKWGMMLHANIMREDVTAVEEGTQFIQLSEQQGWSIEQLMKFFGRSESYINERAELVSKFPDICEHVSRRVLSWPQAKAVMRCKDANHRAYLIDQAIRCGVNARNLNVMVEDFKRQSRLNANIGVPVPASEVYVMPEIELARCVLCQRDDDQANMVMVPVHAYHKRDLEVLIERVYNLSGAAQAGD